MDKPEYLIEGQYKKPKKFKEIFLDIKLEGRLSSYKSRLK